MGNSDCWSSKPSRGCPESRKQILGRMRFRGCHSTRVMVSCFRSSGAAAASRVSSHHQLLHGRFHPCELLPPRTILGHKPAVASVDLLIRPNHVSRDHEL